MLSKKEFEAVKARYGKEGFAGWDIEWEYGETAEEPYIKFKKEQQFDFVILDVENVDEKQMEDIFLSLIRAPATINKLIKTVEDLQSKLSVEKRGGSSPLCLSTHCHLEMFCVNERINKIGYQNKIKYSENDNKTYHVATKVYVVIGGKKYHKKNCSYVKKGAIEIELGIAKKLGYAPDKTCFPEIKPSSQK